MLVLSPNFLTNGGWTKKEFDSIFTREILEAQQLVLPVWHGVRKEQVYEYSPSLLNVKGISWEIGSDEVCRRLYVAIEFAEFMNLNDLFNSFDQAYRNHIPQSIRPEQNFLASRTKGQGRCRLPACRPALRDQSSHSHRRLNQCRLVRRSVD